jgi:hypothetical protein
MPSPSRNKHQFHTKNEAQNYINWYETRYPSNAVGLSRAPSYNTSLKYLNARNYIRNLKRRANIVNSIVRGPYRKR